MRIVRDDLRRLKLPIAVTVMLTLLGVGGVYGTERLLAEAKQQRDSAKKARTEAQERLSRASEEEREIRANLRKYEEMIQRGLVGSENRLDVIDAIANIKKERRLFDIKYTIEAQKPLEYPGIRRAGDLDFATSRMRLDMLLLHEGDLLGFLEDLKSIGRSYVSVQRCSTLRLGQNASATAVVPRLRSECIIDLIILRESRIS